MSTKQRSSAVGASGKYLSLLIASLVTLVPLYVMVLTAFKTKEDYATSGALDLPKKWVFGNFIEAFNRADMASAFVNTTIILVVSVLGTIIIVIIPSLVIFLLLQKWIYNSMSTGATK